MRRSNVYAYVFISPWPVCVSLIVSIHFCWAQTHISRLPPGTVPGQSLAIEGGVCRLTSVAEWATFTFNLGLESNTSSSAHPSKNTHLYDGVAVSRCPGTREACSPLVSALTVLPFTTLCLQHVPPNPQITSLTWIRLDAPLPWCTVFLYSFQPTSGILPFCILAMI